ncbi:MAG: glycoside hydrolase family 16 protein [Agriterribacter sp.]
MQIPKISIILVFLFSQFLHAQEKYKLVWSDEFDKDGRPDSTKWNYEKGFVRNEEFQWYQPENARCEKGMLIIEAKK